MPPALSLLDIARGVGVGHRATAALPGAQRVSLGMRQAQKNMIPSEVVEQYNNAGIFGKTKSGEPIRATMTAQYGPHRNAVERGYMPNTGRIRLDPESKMPKDADAASAPGVYPHIGWYEGQARPGQELLGSELARRMKLHEMTNPLATASMPRAEMLEFNAMDVKPGRSIMPANAWWADLPAKGKELYSLAYDASRAAGHGNVATHLTDVNNVRRLGNVASHSLGHGDTGFISPLQELGYDTFNPGRSSQLFHESMGDSSGEKQYLLKLLSDPGFKRTRDTDRLLHEAMGLHTEAFNKMSPDEILGMMMLREAQLASTYGPKTGNSSPLRISQVKPHEAELLKNVALPEVLANPGKLWGAFGPATLGRQGTTEAMVRGMMQGHEPKEISEILLRAGDPEDYKNRYAKGGLAHAAVTA